MQIILTVIAATLAFLYGLYLLNRRFSGIAGGLLSSVLFVGLTLEVLDLVALVFPDRSVDLRLFGLLCEALLPPLWLLFSATFYRVKGLASLGRFQRMVLFVSPLFVLAVLTLPLEAFYFSPDFSAGKVFFLGSYGFYFYSGIMFCLVLALVNLERTFVSLSQHERWLVKLEFVGAGLLLAMYVVYYSQSLLYLSLDMNLLPARTAALVCSVLIMAYSRLFRGVGERIVLSRGVAYRSVVILIVGLYLVGLGVLGEGMRYLGVPDQKTLFVVIGMLGGVVVLLLLLSEKLRRRVRVFLNKHFYRSKYDYRQQWLVFSDRISRTASPEALQQALLAYYCETFGFKGALLFLREPDTGDYRGAASFHLGGEGVVFKDDNPLLLTLRNAEWILGIAEEDRDAPVCSANRDFLERHAISFVVPLLFEATLEGFIALGERINPDEEMSYEDYDLMRVLARQATSSILNLRLSRQLSTAQELAAIGKISAFIIHDLKNQVSGLSLLVDNARNYMDDPEFQQDMLETVENTVGEMNALIHKLRDLREHPGQPFVESDLMQLVEESVENLAGNVKLYGKRITAKVDAEGIRKVVLNLILNAFEASAEGTPVEIEIGEQGQAFIRVTDRGCGMSQEFVRTRLFRPFETTKKKGSGIGLYQCRQIVAAHGGRIDVESTSGAGSSFTVYLSG